MKSPIWNVSNKNYYVHLNQLSWILHTKTDIKGLSLKNKNYEDVFKKKSLQLKQYIISVYKYRNI